jgi:hypothetical protein
VDFGIDKNKDEWLKVKSLKQVNKARVIDE